MPQEVIAGFRLSPQQKHLWVLQQGDHSLPYHAQCAVLIEGNLDPTIFTAALQQVFARHEILRTTFQCLPGMTVPVQVITDGGLPAIPHANLSGWAPAEQEASIAAFFQEARQVPFDFARGPLARLSFVTLSPDKHLLLVTLSALCADPASLDTLVRDLSRSYAAGSRHEELSDEPRQYADLAEWHNELLESAETETARAYWRKQEPSALLPITLPGEKHLAGQPGFAPRLLTATIPPDMAARIETLSRKYEAPVSVFFLTCWQTLLWRLTGQSDLVIGMACDGRTYEELKDTLGLLAKYLPLPGHLEEHLRFSALLAQVKESTREVLDWQEYFNWEHLGGGQGGSTVPPFFSASFAFTEQSARYTAANVTFSLHTQLTYSDRFKVQLSCVQREEQWLTEFHYDAHLFDADAIERVAGQFHTLLASVIRDPEAAISEFAIVSGAERQQLLVEFNETKTDYPKEACLHHLFEEQVERTPEHVAIVFEDQHLTYAQLNARANQLAHHLQTLGVGPEVPVAMYLEHSLEMIVALLGILKAGGAYVPLDPASPKERLASMLADTQAPVLLTQARRVEDLPEHGAHVVCLDSGWEAVARQHEENPLSRTTAENLAYVIYTSGSTGQPKGVMIEHRSLVNYLCWVTDSLLGDTELRLPLTTKLTFDACLKQLFPPLLRGGEVWMLAEEVLAHPATLLSALGTRTGVGLNCVPSLWKAMLDEIHSGRTLPPTESLTYLLVGGEQLSKELVASSFSVFPHLRIWNFYGPTEATANASVAQIGSGDTISIGQPIANTQIYILDPFGQPVPIGVPGELYIGGVGVARGYLNRPELTAEKFPPNPFSDEPGARLYQTGDLARYLPDGNIECLGRVDHQVKIRGFRIELGEIETVLSRHPAVREALVVAVEDAPGEKRLVAYVVTEQEAAPTSSALRRFLQETLPAYMTPAVFVLLAAWPLLSNGKIDRRALPVPDRARPEEETFVAPRTPTEEMLAGIWTQVLGIERIGIHDNFFSLGGHSLLATQVVSRMRNTFQVEIPLRRLFELPTVAGQAGSIEMARRAGQHLQAPPILPVPRDGDLPLSFAQQRLWFFDQLEPGSAAYNMPAAVRLRGPLNVATLARSLNEIVKRHEALRTTFAMVDGRPVQVIAPTLPLTLPVVDLRARSETERETEVQRLVTAEAQRPFDLAHGPLLRVTLLRLDAEEYVGLLTMHHIVSDGWSTGILIREMAVLYDAFSSGRSSPLPALPIHYADFAHWQRQWLQGDVLETQLAYWKEHLVDAPPLLEVPTDHPRPAVQTFRGAHQSVVLPATLTEGFKVLSRQEGVTLFMTLLAAFKVLLSRYTSQDDLIVGTPVANRNRLEIEGLIGFFVNTLVLRTDLSGNPSFRELVRRVREVCLGAYVHQDLPFERLVEELHLERNLSRNPLFQVMFVLQNAALQSLELPGLTVSPVEAESETAHFDLTLQIVETEHGLTAALVYNTDLFEAATIARMLSHFQTLLEAVVADPEQRLSDLPLLPAAERRQLLVEWNETTTDDSRDDRCIHQLFEAQVKQTPDAIAVVFEDELLTYRELNRRANQLAHHLRALGIGPEVPVGICLERSVEMVIGLLGILKAGGAYVPLDPAYPKPRLAFMLEDAQPPVLLTQERLVAGLSEHEARVVVCLDSDWGVIAQEREENLINATTSENLAYVIYTSGSTGQPKGVLVAHGALAHHCRDVQGYYELDSSDGVLQFASLSFDVSLEEILPTLIVGARLVMQGTDVWPPAEFHEKISALGLTVLNLPTAYWQELAREWANTPELVPNNQPRLVIVGGDTMSAASLKLWQQTPMKAVRLLNAYGPTEATITATACALTPRLGENTAFHRIPIGRPLANRTSYLLDPYGNPVPVGVAGELYIGGLGLARGYLNRPEITAEKFLPNPFSDEPGARLYKTGDLARYLPDGNIEFLGRVDHQVKIRGFRIELGEIEAVLGHHPAVREAVVVAAEDIPGEKRLVAYVVAQQEPAPTISELRRFLRETLPEYMAPAVFVLLEALPLMANGKIDRRALPTLDRARPELEKVFVAPRDALERQLTHIWEEVLDVRPIGVRDNFFELGGHSLLAVRLFSLIEKRLGTRLSLATVFQGATVEHLAGILRQQASPEPRSSLVAIQPGGSKRPLFLVHPAGGHVFPYVQLAHALGPDQPCYGLQARGLEEGRDPHTRIEDMAACYIEALRTVQREGPYLLGGWSMGGVIAFEMARQLHAQGQRVALLALLDARIPTPDEQFTEEDFEAKLLLDSVRYFGLSLDVRESLARLPQDELFTRVLEQAKSASLVPQEIEVSHAQRFVQLLKSDFRATQDYVLHRYPSHVTLFKANEELTGMSLEPTLGWGAWAAGGVEVHVVPGNHATMVYKPHVAVLAEKLKASLSKACLTQVQAADQVLEVDQLEQWGTDGGKPDQVLEEVQ